MSISPRAGKLPSKEDLTDIPDLIAAYTEYAPMSGDQLAPVAFGTSGHRGSSKNGSFNRQHIVAITRAIVEYRRAAGITGPIYVGRDTHALSECAEQTVLSILKNEGTQYVASTDGRVTPTPAVSHAILHYNRNRSADDGQADGILLTPSHNPPDDGGLKYNPPHGGPADTDATGWIEKRANELINDPLLEEDTNVVCNQFDFVRRYVEDLPQVIDIDAIRKSGVRIGVHPLGGSALPYWEAIRDTFGLDITITNSDLDPTFRCVPFDHDGKIRMDCSSPYAMATLVALKDRFDLAIGNDPDADRHGIVTPGHGLLNPNHYLAVAIRYLYSNRSQWPTTAKVGKTLVSSSLIDRVAQSIGREIYEVPVGFKWFVPGLVSGDLAFGGEESAGASFLCRDGSPWSTDKDGILLGLLAAEITAVTGRDPGQHFAEITEQLGKSYYARSDVPATSDQKARLKEIATRGIGIDSMAGEKIIQVMSTAPGNKAPIGGIKIVTASGWCAVRPSGTEDICKVYAESFRSAEHLQQILLMGRHLLG